MFKQIFIIGNTPMIKINYKYKEKNKQIFVKLEYYNFTGSIKDIVISSITFIDNNNFENNPIIITKEEAIEIATNKEKEFSNLEISDTTADLSIEKMNIFIYCLENNITNENGEIKTEDITRNVWVVDVKHNKETKPKDAEIETVKKLYNKKYYIDATTGEIIGGEQSEYFNN